MSKKAPTSMEKAEARLAWGLILPALSVVLLIAIFPLAFTLWESLHVHRLQMPWLNRFVGLGNYLEMLGTARFWAAFGQTAFFTVCSVVLEVGIGLLFALALNRAYRGRGLVRTAVILPWAIPTVISALLWKFMFDTQAGIVNAVLIDAGWMSSQNPLDWFIRSTFMMQEVPSLLRIPLAWIPVILADVWKMTPFVTLLLLAGLQNIDHSLYEAARMDGASRWRQFLHVTLPNLKPAILVTLIFRTLDCFRVFDLIYVLTSGGPGTATEPIALYTFTSLIGQLRFGYGSALSMTIFVITFLLAIFYIKVLGASLTERVQ